MMKKQWSDLKLFRGMVGLLIVAVLLTVTACAPKEATAPEPAVPTETTSNQKPPKGDMGGGMDGGTLDTSAITQKELDIPYGTISDTQKLDIYYPNEASSEPYPVIIAIHGGAFKMGSKTGGDLAPMLEGVNHGYAVVTVDYRLSDEAIFPAAISDVKAAIRFIKANAQQYNLNPDKIATWGDSAGGNLAALAGTSGDDASLNGDNSENLNVSSAVNAVVDWFGPIDFLLMDEQFAAAGITPIMGSTSSPTSPESQYIGGNITENVEQTQKANPENYITASDPAFFIQHGSADQNVPTHQSINLAEKLTAVLGSEKVTLTILEGAGHGGAAFEAADNLDKVFVFLDGVLKK